MKDKTKVFLEFVILVIGFFGGKFLFSIIERSQVGETEYFLKTFLILGLFILLFLYRYFIRPSYNFVIKQKEKGWKISGFYSNYALKSEKLYNFAYDFWVKINLIIVILFELITLIFMLTKLFKFSYTTLFIIVGIYFLFQIFAWIFTSVRVKEMYSINNYNNEKQS